MKRILILNGSLSETPLIKAAKDLGFYVITSGNNPSLIGHKLSDDYVNANFYDKDAILEIAKDRKIDYICSCCHDGGILTASYVAEKLGFPGFDPYSVSRTLHIKDEFKRYCKGRPILTPKADNFVDPRLALKHILDSRKSVVIKPVDSAGGKGVTIVPFLEKNDDLENEELAGKAIDLAFEFSPSKKIVVEDFIEGTLHSCSTFIVNGSVRYYYCDNEIATINPYTVSTSYSPAADWQSVESSLIDTANYLARDLGLCNGILHFQYILSDGRAFILEITRRCSGDLYPLPVSLALGIDWQDLIVRAAAGLPIPIGPVKRQEGFFGRHCIMADKNGEILRFTIGDEIRPNIVSVHYAFQVGEVVTSHLNQKLGVLILRFNSILEAQRKVAQLHSICRAEIKS